jgi:hypothetical protein
MIKWNLKTVNIKDLKDHNKNPRQITKNQLYHLDKLISEFGLIDKPVINQDMTIIGGHQRIKILRKKKVKQVECWCPDRQLEKDELDHLCIGLNLNQGKWDYEILANQWEPIDLLGWGFTEDQLLGSCKEAKDILGLNEEEKNNGRKKTKNCPNCGHEF